MLRSAIIGTCLVMSGGLSAHEAPEYLNNMAGCFSVRFNYVEDGTHDAFYSPVTEQAELSEIDEVFHIRRTLIIEGTEQKHWREEWRELDASTQVWEQTVYGPFDDFRYRCQGQWSENTWRCLAPHSPKPRRDKDRPYAKIDRENTLKINSKRWIHMQNNSKRTADGGLYSAELGWNQYDRIKAEACTIR